ncbi:hypothetical protein ACVOMT_16025 [Sphingomonas panni]
MGKLVAVGVMAPAFYLVISQGAAERGRVEAVERSIVQARKDIRALETEFDTRANMAQLERWNGDVLALAAPRAEQYVGGEHQLASLPGRTEGGNVALAYVVPSAPMEMAAATPEPTLAEASAPVAAPAKAGKAKPAMKPVGAVQTAAVIPAKARAVAMLDRTLLSDATMADLARSARKEAARP